MVQNKSLIFKAIPKGLPVPGKDLTVEATEFDLNKPAPEGGVTLQIIYASFDPYQRGRMRDASIKSYSPAYILSKPLVNGAIAKVLQSATPQFAKGDIVRGSLPTQEYASLSKEEISAIPSLQRIDNKYNLDLKVWLGPLGMPGLTAYSSFYDIGKPVKGETIFISAASGAVGQLVGQLAKHEGLKVLGSVGSQAKLDFIINELRFDGGFNYKEEKVPEVLKGLVGDGGIDIYYDNVGGEQLDAALSCMNDFGRIVSCGAISQYSAKTDEIYGVKGLMNMVTKRLTMRGFIVGDENMGPRYAKEHAERVSKWLSEGSFKSKLSITEGIDNAPEGFVGMLQGKNFGKAILKITDMDL